MNINDVDVPMSSIPPKCLLTSIFERQRELMDKYHPIEEANGLLITHEVPVNIHSAKGQTRLKDFAWRFTEEIGEALEAKLVEGDILHTKEELADSLHFFIEMCILADVRPDDLLKFFTFEELWLHVTAPDWPPIKDRNTVELLIMYLSRACNKLKNKPWKQTQVLTDIFNFNLNMGATFMFFLRLCHEYGVRDEVELYKLYFRKSEVNKFRQRSKY